MTLGGLLIASTSSLVGSPGPVTAGWLGLEFGPVAERVAQPAEAEVAASTPTEDEPEVQTIRLKPRPGPGAISMNLYSRGDFMHQQTTYWCIPASTQTMMNIIDEGQPNRSKAFQRHLYRLGDRLDEDEYGDDDEWERDDLHGMGITEWAALLNHKGYGPYEVDRADTMGGAIRKAAKAIRMTGKPAGLVVWRGAHAWVMSGFTATADPVYTNDFKVVKVYVQDAWYPFVSSIWGASRPPNSAVPVAALAEDYLPYNRPRRRHPMRDGKYMLILPTLLPNTRVH